MAKHSSDLAQAVVDSGALDALVPCLEEFDPTVKEAAAWAIGYIAQHTAELAHGQREGMRNGCGSAFRLRGWVTGFV